MSSTFELNKRTTTSLKNLKGEVWKPKVNNVPSDQDYPKFDLSKQLPALSQKDFYNNLMNMSPRTVFAVQSLRVPITGKTFSYNQSPSIHRPHVSMYKRMFKENLFAQCQDAAGKFRSNNTIRSLSGRMTKCLTTTFTYRNMPEFKNGHPLLPLKVKGYKPSDFSIDHQCFDKINRTADAGLPYAFFYNTEGRVTNTLPKVQDGTLLPLEYLGAKSLAKEEMKIVDHAMYWANKIVKMADDSVNPEDTLENFREMLLSYPELNTFMLKRKDSKEDRIDYDVKCRPYGVQPLAVRWACKYGVHPLENGMVNFQDDRECCSAYRFSIFNGGGDAVKDWIVDFYRGEREDIWRFKGICYGDDQLWIFSYKGKLYAVGPDVRAMDMSTSSDILQYLFPYITGYLYEYPLHKKLSVLSVFLAFRHSLHIGGSYIVGKTNSLISGVILTTFINIFTSSMMQWKVKLFVEKWTGEDFDELYKAIQKMIKEDMNMEFKDAGGPVQIYNDVNQLITDGLSIPFLGVKFVNWNEYWICTPVDFSKFGGTLVLPGNHSKPDAHICDRLMGALISGGFLDPQLNKFIRSAFFDHSKEFTNDVNFDSGGFNEGSQRSLDYLVDELKKEVNMTPLKAGYLPVDEYLYDFYVLPREVLQKEWDLGINFINPQGELWWDYDEDEEENEDINKISIAQKDSKDEVITKTNNNVNLGVDELFKFTFKTGERKFDEDNSSSSSSSSSSDTQYQKFSEEHTDVFPNVKLDHYQVSQDKAGIAGANTLILDKKKLDRAESRKLKRQYFRSGMVSLQEFASKYSKNKHIDITRLSEEDKKDMLELMAQQEVNDETYYLEYQLRHLNKTVADDFSDDEEDWEEASWDENFANRYDDWGEIFDEGNISTGGGMYKKL
jgi:hypothetical protein